MRINKYVALATGMSRRAADTVIDHGRVLINGKQPEPGQKVTKNDVLTLNGKTIVAPEQTTTIMFHKPAGLICSRDGQGGETIYDILPDEYQHLKPVGRLDKDTSGLLLLTNDGQLAQTLTHPSYEKEKRYTVKLNKPLKEADFATITKQGVKLYDGISKLDLDYVNDQNFEWKVTMHEGRNRQIRRTFEALGYRIESLHRTDFGPYTLGSLAPGAVQSI